MGHEAAILLFFLGILSSADDTRSTESYGWVKIVNNSTGATLSISYKPDPVSYCAEYNAQPKNKHLTCSAR
jgi:hypothetical protein